MARSPTASVTGPEAVITSPSSPSSPVAALVVVTFSGLVVVDALSSSEQAASGAVTTRRAPAVVMQRRIVDMAATLPTEDAGSTRRAEYAAPGDGTTGRAHD